MENQSDSKSLVLIGSLIGTLLYLTVKVPRTILKFVVLLVCGTGIGVASTPYVNRLIFGDTKETLFMVAIGLGLVGLSGAFGLIAFVDKRRVEGFLSGRFGIMAGGKETVKKETEEVSDDGKPI
jgi:hypothetical protein